VATLSRRCDGSDPCGSIGDAEILIAARHSGDLAGMVRKMSPPKRSRR
jgi:hypothetical protein